jgi:transcriptional regulator with XRE-family HTH domain
MIKREELLQTEEYWFETLQNEIYRMVAQYMEKEEINQSQFAEKLGVTKGYISQIMNGNFNYTLKKLIELSLAVNKAPAFEFKDLKQFIQDDKQKRFEMEYKPLFNLIGLSQTKNIGLTNFSCTIVSSQVNDCYTLEAA